MNAALHLWRNLDFTWKHSISNGSWIAKFEVGNILTTKRGKFSFLTFWSYSLVYHKEDKNTIKRKEDDLNCFECPSIIMIIFFIALNIGSHHAYPVWYDILIN